MTRQEKIREGIRELLFEHGVSGKRYITRQILNYLHKSGCVLKVEGEKYKASSGSLIGMALARGAEGGEMLKEIKNLMDAVEPLVGERNDP